jgi:hypothetical protein
MSLYLVTGTHYLEVEANDMEEAVGKYKDNVKLQTKSKFNQNRLGYINDYYISVEDWIEEIDNCDAIFRGLVI